MPDVLDRPIPTTPEELTEALTEQGRVQELLNEPGKMAEFIGKYTKNVYDRDKDLGAQMKDALKEGMDEWKKTQDVIDGAQGPVTRLPLDPSALNGGSTGKAATRRAPGRALDAKWPSLGEYLYAIHPDTIQANGVPDVLKNLSESSGGDGGFLVPEEFRAELLRLALESAVVRPRARIIPMSSASLRIPAIRDASHATNVFGGVSGTWAPEAGSISSTTNQPTFTQILLTARKLTGYTVAANELLADSAISLEALINVLFSDALAYFEDDAFINGTGAGQPLGIINADALVSQAKENGQAATTIVYENIIKMYSRMLPQSINRAVWLAHPDTFPQLATMALNVGTGGSAVWLSNAVGGPPATILGRPVVITEKAQTLGTAGDLSLVDFSYYLIGDRQALTVMASPHVNFTTDEMVWRFVQRVDGRPWLQVALTPRNGSNTLSPFVNLVTRS